MEQLKLAKPLSKPIDEVMKEMKNYTDITKEKPPERRDAGATSGTTRRVDR